ncbi:hypothetical protein ACFV2H_42865 [Streptomyces sp. NPDC059629]|uniref:hypothetical protein n=1 Tax=Streptomyces sp. NPDC059629 TaxID=3346889 RepID=UPI0036BDD70E
MYDASWAALPTPAEIACGRAPGGPADVLVPAGAITAYAEDPRRKVYEREIGELLAVGRGLLTDAGIPAPSFVICLQSVPAFEGPESSPRRWRG